uniref:phosphoserine phosphatase n=1 Tax=Compsopogon caeruleus TaxID=31354 RepID=A0A7S1TBH6_9RHOD|mmetsp:Transcript_16458/g.33575  ORF Transcript_16458/g.33575 Transcript_16458/m.33575 type:complete len:439 (+) Transcript_16458:117-1433(+)
MLIRPPSRPPSLSSFGSELSLRNKEHVVITFTGDDRVGITMSVTTAVARCRAEIMNMQQIVAHGRLTLALEVRIGLGPDGQRIFREMLKLARKMDLRVEFDMQDPVEDDNDSVEDTASTASSIRYASELYVVTLLGTEPISVDFLSEIGSVLEKRDMWVTLVQTLSESSLRCVELTVSTEERYSKESIDQLRRDLYLLGMERFIDVAFQAESILRRGKRLVVMDMDSTLIQQEVIDEIAKHAGVHEQVKEITHRAMGGSMDFNQSLEARVRLLKGAHASVFDKVIENLIYTDGADRLCRSLKKLGYRLAVISGGFTAITDHVRRVLNLDYHFANTLEVDSTGCFTGRTVGPVVNAQRKADLLRAIAQQERIDSLSQVIAIGDGANDLPMLGIAGLGVAFNAKPAVQEAARFRLNQKNLDSVLYLLGLSEADQMELSSR